MLGGVMVVIAFVVILMAHEGGHLVTAKLLNIKATRYFLGFGPTIWSFQRGETEYGSQGDTGRRLRADRGHECAGRRGAARGSPRLQEPGHSGRSRLW